MQPPCHSLDCRSKQLAMNGLRFFLKRERRCRRSANGNQPLRFWDNKISRSLPFRCRSFDVSQQKLFSCFARFSAEQSALGFRLFGCFFLRSRSWRGRFFRLFPLRFFFFRSRRLLHHECVNPFDKSHRRGIALAPAKFHNAGITAVASGRSWRHFIEQFFHHILLPQNRQCGTSRVQRSFLAERHHFLRQRTHCFRFGQCGLDALVFDQAANLIGQQRLSMLGGSPKLNRFFLMSHCKPRGENCRLGRSADPIWTCTLDADHRHLHHSSFEFHTQAQAELLELILNLVKRLLAKVSILEHLALALLRQLANRGDVRVVQTIRRAHAELDFVHAHVEQFLQLHVLFAYTRWGLVELDHVFVKVHEYVEVMAKDGGGLEQRVVRC